MQLTGADAKLRQAVCSPPFWKDLTRLGVAVSGGGDSVALLHLLADCAPEHGVTLEAATVDHGLRPEAADEAAFVADTCADLGIPHQTLHWEGWDGQGNLQAQARAARYRLLAGWAQSRWLDAVALGHTRDDQAETFLMRLAREAGVDGLAAMDARFSREGAVFWRPALALERAELRDFLTRHHLRWHDDPSNDDESYDRVKARKALDVLAGLGIGPATLQGVAINLAAARRALTQASREQAERIAAVHAGDVVFDRAGLLATQPEIRRRLIVAALRFVSSAAYAPRRDALTDLEAALAKGRPYTLQGCLVTPRRDTIRFAREFNAVKDEVTPFGKLWDGRWRVTGPGAGLMIRALGEAVKDCPDWRESGLPRTSLLASPAVWDASRLVAAPLAGLTEGYSATIDAKAGDFFTSTLSH